MTKNQAAFNLLVLLLSVNDTLSGPKKNMALNFINDYCDEIDFDPQQEMQQLLALNANEKESRIIEIAQWINLNEVKENKEAFLDYAISVLAINTTLSKQEQASIQAVSEIWKIDDSKLL